ncbi:MAG: JAB domain-containing protein [Eubacteriales bacterium]|nr:JAB domain-containing protein [Eubacteriales bacterium]
MKKQMSDNRGLSVSVQNVGSSESTGAADKVRADNPHEGHRQRLKQTFLNGGVNSMHEHQLLELLLFYALPRKDVNQIAHSLIDRFGSLHGVIHADPNDLMREGLSENTAVLLRLAGVIAPYSERTLLKRTQFNNLDSVIDFSYRLIGHCREERICIISLSKAFCLLHYDIYECGSTSRISLPMRTVVESALRHGAVNVVIAHNHPSGQYLPSDEDITATGELRRLLGNLDIVLSEHIIVGYPCCYAMIKNYSKDVSQKDFDI